ncbi:MAG: DUF5606 domain-containing protein [Bacteroidota bacterium]|jgi:hypothetical protein
MNLKEIVAISGVSGLHKIIGRTKTGLILESLNETKKRFPTSIQDKVSVLDDISMYTLEGDMRLAEVFVKLNQAKNVPGTKEDPKTQRNFLVDIIQLDSERVYDSDIKKLLTWYHILQGVIDFSKLLQEDEPAQETPAATEVVKAEEEAAPKKAAKKSAKKSDADDAEAATKKTKTAAKKTAAKKAPKTEE